MKCYVLVVSVALLSACQGIPLSLEERKLCEAAGITHDFQKCSNYIVSENKKAQEKWLAEQEAIKNDPALQKYEYRSKLYQECINRVQNNIAAHNANEPFKQIILSFDDMYSLKAVCKCESEQIMTKIEAAPMEIFYDEIEMDIWLSKTQADATKKCADKITKKSKAKK